MKRLHFNHEKLLLIAIWVWLIWWISTLGRELPVRSVIDPTVAWCDKSLHRNELDDACKMQILEHNVIGWQAQAISNLVLSVLRGSSYSQWRIAGSWWHPSIDLVSVAWTPVFAMFEWVVVSARERWWYGNSITIRHTLPDWTIIFSNYSHLESMMVQEWENITTGKQIWSIGKTWFTIGKYWNHLDFQITTAESPSHPYWYGDCPYWYMHAVEQWSCFELLEKYTLDPIQFYKEYAWIDLSPLAPEWYFEYRLEKWNSHNAAPRENEQHIENEDEISEKDVIILWEESMLESTETIPRDTQWNIIFNDNALSTLLALIRRDRWLHTQSINSSLERDYADLQEINSSVASETTQPKKPETTVPWYTILRELWTNEFMMERLNRIVFTVTDKFGNAFHGELPERITLEYEREWISIAPGRFSRVSQWSRSLFITPQKTGTYTLKIFYGDNHLWTEIITVSW